MKISHRLLVGMSRDRHRGEVHRSEVRAFFSDRAQLMAFEEAGHAALAHEVEEAGPVLGTGDVLDEANNLPCRMDACMQGRLVVGEQHDVASDPHGLMEHARAFGFGVLVQREQQQAGIERAVLERELVGGPLNVGHVPSAASARNGHHIVGQIETRRLNPGSSQRAALISCGAGDIEDMLGPHLPTHSHDLRP